MPLIRQRNHGRSGFQHAATYRCSYKYSSCSYRHGCDSCRINLTYINTRLIYPCNNCSHLTYGPPHNRVAQPPTHPKCCQQHLHAANSASSHSRHFCNHARSSQAGSREPQNHVAQSAHQDPVRRLVSSRLAHCKPHRKPSTLRRRRRQRLPQRRHRLEVSFDRFHTFFCCFPTSRSAE